MAVTHELFTDKANAGKAGRSNAKRPTSSAAMCCASAALPPFPNKRALFPCLSAFTRTSLTFATVNTTSVLRSRLCFVAIDASISSLTRGSKSFVCFIHPPQTPTPLSLSLVAGLRDDHGASIISLVLYGCPKGLVRPNNNRAVQEH